MLWLSSVWFMEAETGGGRKPQLVWRRLWPEASVQKHTSPSSNAEGIRGQTRCGPVMFLRDTAHITAATASSKVVTTNFAVRAKISTECHMFLSESV